MADNSMRRVAVLGGSRIPFCRSHTAYAELSNLDMLTAALGGLVDRFALHGTHIDEVAGGAVVTHAKDWNLAREAVIGSALAPTTPAITMMQACGTSLAGALGIAAKIATGQIESGISLGSDTTSDAPVVFQRRFAQRLVQLSRARRLGQKAAAFKTFTPAELAPQPDAPSSLRRLPAPRPPARVAEVRSAADSPAAEGDVGADTAREVRPAGPVTPPAKVVAIAPARFRVQFTASAELEEKIQRARALLRHKIPSGDVAAIVDEAMTVLVAKLERRRCGAAQRPRTGAAVASASRDIPAAVRRAVWQRDES